MTFRVAGRGGRARRRAITPGLDTAFGYRACHQTLPKDVLRARVVILLLFSPVLRARVENLTTSGQPGPEDQLSRTKNWQSGPALTFLVLPDFHAREAEFFTFLTILVNPGPDTNPGNSLLARLRLPAIPSFRAKVKNTLAVQTRIS